MFTGITLATIMADVADVLPEIAGGVGIILAFWGSGRVVKLFKRLMGRA